jgi:phosphohistidine phosphatase
MSVQHSSPTLPCFTEETDMDLLLWRHAEAEDGIPDLQRKLTARGEKQAQRIAAWLRSNGPKNLRILVSPALRCQQTAQALELPFEIDKRLGTDSHTTNLLSAAGWPQGGDKASRKTAVLVVGHQPTLGQTAALLLSGTEASWSVKKGALWWFSNRTRQGETQTVLRAVIPADFS